MNKCIVIKLIGDECVKVMHPVNRSVDECYTRALKDYKGQVEYIEIQDKSAIPKDRYFRDAWCPCPNKGIKEDLDKCKNIHMDRLRIERNKKLEDSDKELLRAVESGDEAKVNEVKAKRIALRDMPQNCDMSVCNSPDDVRAVRPAILDS